MLWFAPFWQYSPGLVFQLLTESHSSLLRELPGSVVGDLLAEWEEYDARVFQEVDTLGSAGFISLREKDVVGFASWDPRGMPAVGAIGHNCILPEFRGRGFGQHQVKEILRRFGQGGAVKARVLTDEHPFYGPAVRMYERCGFQVVERLPGTYFEGYSTLAMDLDFPSRSGYPSS